MRVVIIGGTRFLGISIARGLLRRGHEVVSLHRGNTKFEIEGMQEVLMDKNDRDSFGEFLSKVECDAVIDTILSDDDLRFVIPIIDGKIENYVHCGSTGVYAPMKYLPAREEDECDPLHELGGYESKLHQDQVLLNAYEESGFPATILRPSNIYGPGDIPLDIWGGRSVGFFRRLTRNENITVPNDGKALLQPGYVEDLGDAFSLPLEHGNAIGQVFNISSERCVPLNTYLEIMMNIVGSSSSVDYMPIDEMIKTYSQYLGSWPAGLKFVCEHMCIDISKAKNRLGYAPKVSLEEGLGRNLDWMRKEGMISY
ncbi:MAG: NAD-dependent epimerase/dehydratase family protein [Theionarchaea archaeon]|nr:NAD-dependent epimerase/dehydratase family protein [Theionarchaea archaeon]